MADVLLNFGIDPSSGSSIASQLDKIISGMHPKVKLDIDDSATKAAYKEYKRLNEIIVSTTKSISQMSSGKGPNSTEYVDRMKSQLRQLMNLKTALNNGLNGGDAIFKSDFTATLDKILAKISDIKGAYETIDGTKMFEGSTKYEQSLSGVEAKLREVTALQSDLANGTKIADEKTASDINRVAAEFQNLAANMDGMKVDEYREKFSGLSRELENLQSKVTTPVQLLGDDPTKLASTMGELQRILNSIDSLQERIQSGKGVASSETVDGLNALRNAVRQFYAEAESAPKDLGAEKVAQFRSQLVKLQGDVKTSSSVFNNFFNGFGAGIKSYLAMSLSWMRIIQTTIQEVKQMVETSIELDTAFTQLQIVTRVSDSEMGQFAGTLAETAKNMSSSVKDMAEVATVYARLGYTLDESNVMAQYTAMIQNVGDIDSGAASDALTAIVKAYGMGVEDIESVMDRMVEVGKEYCPAA